MGYTDSVVIYTLDGRETMRTSPVLAAPYGSVVPDRKITVSTAGLAPGVYFYKVMHGLGNGGNISSKIGKLVLTK